MKSLKNFIIESQNPIIKPANKFKPSYSIGKLLDYMFDEMEDDGYSLDDEDIRKILSDIASKAQSNDLKVHANHLRRKLVNDGKVFMISMSELDKYNDKKDILSEWGDTYYYGDSHEYIEITKSNGEYYVKGYNKPFPYKELGVCTQPEHEDYMPTKDDPFKFERTTD